MPTILQAVYRRQADPTISVPAPVDGDGDPFWYDHLAYNMHSYANAGFTHFLLPPVHMTIGGSSPGADGYGFNWEYSLGTKSSPTRFGYAEILQRLCAVGYANGMLPLADWVPHQRYGGRNGVYRYRALDGSMNGRFPKDPGCFLGDQKDGRVPRDPIAGPVADDFAFGDELCPINGKPNGYVLDGLIESGDWLYRRLDLAGCRDDDTKGQAFEAVKKWADAKAMTGKPVIGEYADGNRDTLAWWIDGTGGRCAAYDFDIKYKLQRMCNNGSRWDMRQLVNAGLAGRGAYYAYRSVTFVENSDSDTNGFGSVVFNKLLAYAYLLTAEGFPSIYYRDYAQEKYCYGLAPKINNLLWIHEHLANGSTWFRAADYQYIVYERQGPPGLLVGLNNDVWDNQWKKVTVQTRFGANRHLHDYTGHSDDVWTDGNGNATIWLPPNANGTGFVAFAPDGLSQPNVINRRSTTQVFEGASDLADIRPAYAGDNLATRIWCDAGYPIHLAFEGQHENLTLSLDDPDKKAVALIDGKGKTTKIGWHEIWIKSTNAAPTPYTIAATYTATQKLAEADIAVEKDLIAHHAIQTYQSIPLGFRPDGTRCVVPDPNPLVIPSPVDRDPNEDGVDTEEPGVIDSIVGKVKSFFGAEGDDK